MKKVLKLIFTLIILLPCSIKALEVSSNNVSIKANKSKTIELYANTNEEIKSLVFTLTFITYDIPAYYEPGDGINDATPNSITHNITFNETKTGKIYLGNIVVSVKQFPTVKSGTVNINSAKAITVNDEEVKLNSQDINVIISTEEVKEEKKDPNLLDKIESNIVKIELTKDVFEYEVEVNSSIEELDLKAIAKESSTNIDISSQKIEKDKDNEIIITTKNGSTEQKYTIKVKVNKEEEKEENKDLSINIDLTKKDTKKEDNNGLWITTIVLMSIIILVGLLLNKKK